MLIKLDSGDYVNTDNIERLWMVDEHTGFARFLDTPDVFITEADRDRIVDAFHSALLPQDAVILFQMGKPAEIKLEGVRYSLSEVTDDGND
jgi:hypothetical protein